MLFFGHLPAVASKRRIRKLKNKLLSVKDAKYDDVADAFMYLYLHNGLDDEMQKYEMTFLERENVLFKDISTVIYRYNSVTRFDDMKCLVNLARLYFLYDGYKHCGEFNEENATMYFRYVLFTRGLWDDDLQNKYDYLMTKGIADYMTDSVEKVSDLLDSYHSSFANNFSYQFASLVLEKAKCRLSSANAWTEDIDNAYMRCLARLNSRDADAYVNNARWREVGMAKLFFSAKPSFYMDAYADPIDIMRQATEYRDILSGMYSDRMWDKILMNDVHRKYHSMEYWYGKFESPAC